MADNYWDNLMSTDEGAASYMATYGEGPGYATRFLVGEFINDGETVLDVGCGPGWNFDHFMQYGPKISRYKGLDYSERFVRVANKRVKEKAKTSTGPFELGDVRNINEPEGSWDVVILQDVLEHTNGYEKPVENALNVARQRVIVTFWHLTEDDDHINEDGNDGWGAWYSKPKWEDYLNKLSNKLSFVWHYIELAPEGKTHQWDFYILEKQS